MTDLVISIDLEFDLNGTFEYAERRPLGRDSIRVSGEAGLGLDAILEPLEQNGFRGVFFTEVLNCHYFGPDEMGDVAKELHERGHELQLHAHPVWTLFTRADWQQYVRDTDIRTEQYDNFAGLSAAATGELLEQGLQRFAAWSLPRPVAFRTGNLLVSRENYRAMAAQGIELSSSVGLGASDAKRRDGQVATIDEIEGVLEVPVTRFSEIDIGRLKRERLFTLTGCSQTALRQVPQQAHRQGLSPLVLLTHAAEFMPALVGDGVARVNARKFREFCEFLALHRERFDVVTMAARIEHWRQQRPHEPGALQFPLLRGLQSLVDRVIELKIRAA